VLRNALETSLVTLDLTSSSFSSIEQFSIFNQVTAIVGSSDLGAGKISASSLITGDGTFRVVKDAAGEVDLTGLVVGAGIVVEVHGTSGADTIHGPGGPHVVFRGGDGSDTIFGNNFGDVFQIAGAHGQFDAMSGGGGDDTLEVIGLSPVVLNGFNASASSIETWLGNGSGLTGNVAANVFDLSGLTAKTALPSLSGSAGNDVLTGSIFADTLLGGANVDRLTGGRGRDLMTGGTQRDIFDFNAVGETGKTVGHARHYH